MLGLSKKKQNTILIVDDESDIRLLLSTYLKSWGYNVIEAKDGRQGMDLAKKKSPKLIILDVTLPEMNGFDCCSILKRIPETKNVPVILLTGLSKTGSVEEGFSCGADSYLIKPIDWNKLQETIDGLIPADNQAP
ncbi:MAG: response regulator [Elusimicrobiota bacterium]